MKKNQFYLIAMLTLALQLPVLLASAQSEPVVAYISIQTANGVLKGNSTAKATAGMIECVGYSYTMKSALTIGSQSSGAGSGRINPITIQIIKHSDDISSQLMQMMMNGQMITSLTIQIYKGGGESPTLIQSIKFDAVGISQITQYAGKSNTIPDEEILFTAVKVDTGSSADNSNATTNSGNKTVSPAGLKYNLKENKKN